MYPLCGQNEGLVNAFSGRHFIPRYKTSVKPCLRQAFDTEVAGLIKHGPQGTSQTSVHICRLPKLLTHCLPIDSSHNMICFRETSRLATSCSFCQNKFLLLNKMETCPVCTCLEYIELATRLGQTTTLCSLRVCFVMPVCYGRDPAHVGDHQATPLCVEAKGSAHLPG